MSKKVNGNSLESKGLVPGCGCSSGTSSRQPSIQTSLHLHTPNWQASPGSDLYRQECSRKPITREFGEELQLQFADNFVSFWVSQSSNRGLNATRVNIKYTYLIENLCGPMTLQFSGFWLKMSPFSAVDSEEKASSTACVSQPGSKSLGEQKGKRWGWFSVRNIPRSEEGN